MATVVLRLLLRLVVDVAGSRGRCGGGIDRHSGSRINNTFVLGLRALDCLAEMLVPLGERDFDARAFSFHTAEVEFPFM